MPSCAMSAVLFTWAGIRAHWAIICFKHEVYRKLKLIFFRRETHRRLYAPFYTKQVQAKCMNVKEECIEQGQDHCQYYGHTGIAFQIIHKHANVMVDFAMKYKCLYTQYRHMSLLWYINTIKKSMDNYY